MPPSSSTKRNLLIILFIFGLFLLIGWYGLILAQSLKDAVHLRELDFSIFYISGRIAREYGWDQIYNLQRQVEMESRLVGRQLVLNELLPYNHPPLLLPLQVLIAIDDYVRAYFLWMVLQTLILIVAGFWVYRLVRRQGWDKLPSWFMAANFALFYPVIIGLIKGQDTGLALLGLTVCFSGVLLKDDRESGLGLSLLVLRPQLALALGLPFLFKRRQVWWWFLGAASVLTLFSLLLVGRQGVQDFVRMLAISANGEQVVIHAFDMYNLKGMLIRLFPQFELTIIPITTWSAYLLAIVLLCIWWARSSDVSPRQFALAVILILFVSPHLHYHDLGLLLVPILALCLDLVRQNRLSPLGAGLLVMGINYYVAIILLTPWHFIGVYLMMAILAGGLLIRSGNPASLQPAKETI